MQPAGAYHKYCTDRLTSGHSDPTTAFGTGRSIIPKSDCRDPSSDFSKFLLTTLLRIADTTLSMHYPWHRDRQKPYHLQLSTENVLLTLARTTSHMVLSVVLNAVFL